MIIFSSCSLAFRATSNLLMSQQRPRTICSKQSSRLLRPYCKKCYDSFRYYLVNDNNRKGTEELSSQKKITAGLKKCQNLCVQSTLKYYIIEIVIIIIIFFLKFADNLYFSEPKII